MAIMDLQFYMEASFFLGSILNSNFFSVPMRIVPTIHCNAGRNYIHTCIHCSAGVDELAVMHRNIPRKICWLTLSVLS